MSTDELKQTKKGGNEMMQTAVNKLIQLLKDPFPEGQHRILIALVGVPASGKTTLAQLICREVNAHLAKTNESEDSKVEDICTVMPMDGYHMTRKELDAMEDPIRAHACRGAHWTFDVDRLAKAIEQVATSRNDVLVDGWDHAIKVSDRTVTCSPVPYTLIYLSP